MRRAGGTLRRLRPQQPSPGQSRRTRWWQERLERAGAAFGSLHGRYRQSRRRRARAALKKDRARSRGIGAQGRTEGPYAGKGRLSLHGFMVRDRPPCSRKQAHEPVGAIAASLTSRTDAAAARITALAHRTGPTRLSRMPHDTRSSCDERRFASTDARQSGGAFACAHGLRVTSAPRRMGLRVGPRPRGGRR